MSGFVELVAAGRAAAARVGLAGCACTDSLTARRMVGCADGTGTGGWGGFRFSNKAWFSFKNSWGLGPVAFSFLFGK